MGVPKSRRDQECCGTCTFCTTRHGYDHHCVIDGTKQPRLDLVIDDDVEYWKWDDEHHVNITGICDEYVVRT